MVYYVKLLVDMAGMLSLKTHLKGVLVLSGVFDIGFLFIFEILDDVQKGSGYNLRSMPCQKNSVSPASIYILDLCPNI